MSQPPDVAALERFIAERGAGLERAAWFLTGDHQLAEDLLQTALAKAWRQHMLLGNDYKFEAYLRTTMYRTFVSWRRRRSWRAESVAAEVDDLADDPAAAEARVDLLRALEELTRMQRTVVVLRYLEDRSIAEVAELLGISVGAVKTHAHRGCTALRASVHLAEEEVPS